MKRPNGTVMYPGTGSSILVPRDEFERLYGTQARPNELGTGPMASGYQGYESIYKRAGITDPHEGESARQLAELIKSRG